MTDIVMRIRQFRDSFWFMPSTLVVLGLVLGELAVTIDRQLETDEIWAVEQLRMGVEGARGMLTAIGSSMLAVASTSFSITVSVIATASSTYGPRLVRNFMTDRRNQFVLGQFVATYVYVLVVLRSISSSDVQGVEEAFIPYLGVYFAIVLAIVNVMSLVYFIHHVADSIQISDLVADTRQDLRTAVQRQYTDEAGEGVATPSLEGGYVITAEKTGYVTSIDERSLLRCAAAAGGVIEVLVPVGHHLIPGEPLLRANVEVDDQRSKLVAAFTIDDARTPTQDVRFATQQMVEMAVRALSPGTNDPYTARNAVAELGAAMSELTAVRDLRAGRLGDDGELRLIVYRVPVIEVVDLVFDDLRAYGYEHPTVVRETIRLGHRIMAVATPDVAKRVQTHLMLMIDALEASGAPEFDVQRTREAAAAGMPTSRQNLDGAPPL